MSRQDADRIVALVSAVEALANGERQSLGELASKVLGWSDERVFLAIEVALAAKRIGRNEETSAIEVREGHDGDRGPDDVRPVKRGTPSKWGKVPEPTRRKRRGQKGPLST